MPTDLSYLQTSRRGDNCNDSTLHHVSRLLISTNGSRYGSVSHLMGFGDCNLACANRIERKIVSGWLVRSAEIVDWSL